MLAEVVLWTLVAAGTVVEVEGVVVTPLETLDDWLGADARAAGA